jgi:hypothetical protein
MYIEKFCFLPVLVGFLLIILFDPEDEHDIFLWDVGEHGVTTQKTTLCSHCCENIRCSMFI